MLNQKYHQDIKQTEKLKRPWGAKLVHSKPILLLDDESSTEKLGKSKNLKISAENPEEIDSYSKLKFQYNSQSDYNDGKTDK